MTIIFPTSKEDGLSAKRGAHFGKASYYTAVKVENNLVTEVIVHKNPGHSTGNCANAVANIQALGANAVIVAGIGASPLKKFLELGIDIYFDDKNATVEESLQDFLNGKTAKIDPNHSCSHQS